MNITGAVFWLILALGIMILTIMAVVVWKLAAGKVKVEEFVAEPESGKASLSRLQMLVFTFVVAGLYFVLCLEHSQFLEIPGGVLGLLGISAGSYVLSKGITEQSKRAEKEIGSKLLDAKAKKAEAQAKRTEAETQKIIAEKAK